MTLLVLYEELADYFIHSLTHFTKEYDVKALVIHKKQNPVAPFIFESSDSITLLSREELDVQEIQKTVSDFGPAAILCGGWSYPPYLSICEEYQKSIPVVLGFDNWWTGSFKQRIAGLLSKFIFHKRFNRVFVPGIHQKEFALKLGFSNNAIRDSAYCCNYELFSGVYDQREQNASPTKEKKILLYMGRYAPEKGIKELWQTFAETAPPDWELWCIGTGEITPLKHAQIRHIGFVHPEDLGQYLITVDAFILPSFFEPWGVVVHELATAGIPIISSCHVGAAEIFVSHNVNGLIFDSKNTSNFSDTLKVLFTKNDDALREWGKMSRELSKRITNQVWSKNLMDLINNQS